MSSGDVDEPLVRATESFNTTLEDFKKRRRIQRKSAKHSLKHSFILGRHFYRYTINVDSWLDYNRSYLLMDGYILTCHGKIKSRWAIKVLNALNWGALWVINTHRNHIEIMHCTDYVAQCPRVSRERFDITWVREKYPSLCDIAFKIFMDIDQDSHSDFPRYVYRVSNIRVDLGYLQDRSIELPIKNPGEGQKRVLEL